MIPFPGEWGVMAEHSAIERKSLLLQHQQSRTFPRKGMSAFERATATAVVDCPLHTSQNDSCCSGCALHAGDKQGFAKKENIPPSGVKWIRLGGKLHDKGFIVGLNTDLEASHQSPFRSK